MGHPAKAENHQPPSSKHNGYAEAAGSSPSATKALPKAPKSPYKSPLPEKLPPASSYASQRTTLPAEPARTPLWIY